MTAPEAEAKAELAYTRYLQLKADIEAAEADVHDACAAAIQAGSTPERLAERLSLTTTEIRAHLPDLDV